MTEQTENNPPPSKENHPKVATPSLLCEMIVGTSSDHPEETRDGLRDQPSSQMKTESPAL